jgi:hypothetical protein
MKTCTNCRKPLPPRRRLYCSDGCRRREYSKRRWLKTFLAKHAISPEVGNARPYVRYAADDPSPVQTSYKELPQPWQRGTMTRFAKRADGVVITRHAPPHLGVDRILPELRPDHPIKTKPLHRHCHPIVPTKDIPVIPTGPSAGRELSKQQIHTAKAMQRHIARDKYEDDHKGVNDEGVHCHQALAKYLFPPAPTKVVPWSSRRQKDKSVNYAKRIDVHPLALPLLETAKRVFFVIEGCIKADAVLSAGEAVFSVPSVTLWNAPELRQFVAAYLHGKTIIIVPDSDWHENGAVLTQAMLARSFLRRMGVRAIVAAPPPDLDGKKQGVDDFLAAGGCLDDLLVINREVNPGLRTFLDAHIDQRKDGQGRNQEVLAQLTIHADTEGQISKSIRSLARIGNLPHKRVARALEALTECGAISVDKPLSTRRGYFSRALEWEGDPPTITILPELRAIESPPMTLREWGESVEWQLRWDLGHCQPHDVHGGSKMELAMIKALKAKDERDEERHTELLREIQLSRYGETVVDAAERLLSDTHEGEISNDQ